MPIHVEPYVTVVESQFDQYKVYEFVVLFIFTLLSFNYNGLYTLSVNIYANER